MAFTDITSTASVRAVLGVSEKEIRDDVLLDPIYSTQVFEALYAISPDLLTDYMAIAPLNPMTAQQLRFVNLTQTYAAYAVAGVCLGSVAMFAPVTIKDSKSEQSRATDPYSMLRGDVAATLKILLGRLISAYGAINPTLPVVVPRARVNVLLAPLGVNPITG